MLLVADIYKVVYKDGVQGAQVTAGAFRYGGVMPEKRYFAPYFLYQIYHTQAISGGFVAG